MGISPFTALLCLPKISLIAPVRTDVDDEINLANSKSELFALAVQLTGLASFTTNINVIREVKSWTDR